MIQLQPLEHFHITSLAAKAKVCPSQGSGSSLNFLGISRKLVGEASVTEETV
jgi:hypothetical protein